ncbi:MAG TPA: GyrI-like domain-containing protein [Candidatus Atribacteria bacterium]|nr:GyrI-like domain-containing protein [Candidatus Atribacteria bacterium]HPT78670.1 GyrI-like domain-containing protein [Candidatus Atribacteria bacterium]
MAEIIKAYKQEVPAFRFIGRKYGDDDRVNGSFGAIWGEWFANGWFETLENLASLKDVYEDGDAYIGLMRYKEGEPFQYWIGIFMPENTPVPEGFEYVDFPAGGLGVCWVYGQEHEVYCHEMKCAEKLAAEGYEVKKDDKGALWFFERYACPRFTTPDEKGNIILDICFYIK